MEMMMPMSEPEEEKISVTISKFGFRLVTEGEGAHNREDLETFSEAIIKPVFIRGSSELEKKWDDELEFKINSVENGSVVVEGSVIVTILISSGVATIATGLLTNILTHNLYSPNDKKQYQLLMSKLGAISKFYTQQSMQEFNKKRRIRTFVTLPNSTETKVQEFYFDAIDYEEAKAAIADAVRNYHSNTNKP